MKKIILFMILIISVFCLCSCGDGSHNDEDEASVSPGVGIYDVIDIPKHVTKDFIVGKPLVDANNPDDVLSVTYWFYEEDKGTHIDLDVFSSADNYAELMKENRAVKKKYGENVFYDEVFEEGVAKTYKSVWIGRDGHKGLIQCSISSDKELTDDEVKTFEEFLSKIILK